MNDEKRETLDQEVAHLRHELAFAQKKIQIVGSVTRHDILNQMTAIMGYNELILTLEQDEKILGFLEIERRASDKIRRVFAFSKVFQLAGTEPPRWQRLDALVHLACEEAELKGIPVKQDVTGISLFAEPQISKAFSYLFDNAVRHGKKTTEIRVGLEEGGSAFIIVVSDDGVGIAAGDKEKIFEHGFGKHTGWGLFVTREILSVSGMGIRETGEPGAGARFEITIPREFIRKG